MDNLPYWLVTVEKIATGKRQQRRVQAANAEQAGEKTVALIGGPAASSYRVLMCKPDWL
jgi:hypothetical protein